MNTESTDYCHKEYLDILRHSTSHVMAQAVKELFSHVQLGIGPSTEDGFYYDFDCDTTFTLEMLSHIETKMREIIKRELPITRKELPKKSAKSLFESMGEHYKVEILEDIEDDMVTIFEQGDFADLCRGPHISSTKEIRAFKLLSLAGAYWKGDERNKMLQRIYGTAFPNQKELDSYLFLLEEAKKRDHRRLGKELDLFSISEEAGPGLVIYHPKGALLRTILEDFERKEHIKRGYHMVKGPQLLKLSLWEKSGHWENYKENMYFSEIDDQKYGIKPMNCLAHMLIYKSKIRSYRDLPIRYFELGTVHRHEKSGVLHGLLRVREFTQDDAHILCTRQQLEREIIGVIEFVKDMMELFEFPYELELSTRPKDSIGTDSDWESGTQALINAMESLGLSYRKNEGEGAFYGPKIDIKLRDVLNRKWQCATIQADLSLPERFDLTYVGPDGERHRPVMLHRTILGSMERFIGILIEHYGGAFPTWLAPVQAVVMTVTDRGIRYGKKVVEKLCKENIRVEEDFRNEKLGLKVREAQIGRTPYMIIIGDKEVESKTLSIRKRSGEELNLVKVKEFLKIVEKDCKRFLRR